MERDTETGNARETRLWLIRHAESTWNAAGLWQGQSDPPLSEAGRLQAERLAEALVDEQVDVVVTSDLARTRETAELVARRLGLALHAEPGLRELDAGTWSGSSRAEIERRDGTLLADFDTGDPEVRAGGGECRREVAHRARRALAAWSRRHAGARLAVVTHSGVIRSLLPGVRVANARWHAVAARAVLGGHGDDR
jgi:broad specificity phosphatase PhoE